MKTRWRFGLFAGLILALFSLYPQARLMYLRGAEFQGQYAISDTDEMAYAAYVRSLAENRSRRNDPYTGQVDLRETPQAESLFSIQFAAPYIVAVPARILGISVPLAMVLTGAAAAFLTGLTLFWLIRSFTGDDWFASSGGLLVAAGGALFAGEGAIREILFDSIAYPYFPGFRRYIPAIVMPAFFAMLTMVGRILSVGTYEKEIDPAVGRRGERSAAMITLCALSTTMFAFCVFSYFYVWTTAAAWLACVIFVWLIARPDGFLTDIKRLAFVSAGCVVSLVPYFFLLAKRSPVTDESQLLIRTHLPDLTRTPELIAFAVLAVLALGCIAKLFSYRDRTILFTASLAAAVIVVFNQQIVTGRSLQPIHYQVFIGNYVAGLSLVLALWLIVKSVLRPAVKTLRIISMAAAAIAVCWGYVECVYTIAPLDAVNMGRDRSVPAARRLAEASGGEAGSTVLCFDVGLADDLPALTGRSVYWAPHQFAFSSMTKPESDRRYFAFLYYLGYTPPDVEALLKRDVMSQRALFGWGRQSDRLNLGAKPLSIVEIQAAALQYKVFREQFSAADAASPPISTVIVPANGAIDLTVLAKWYTLDAGETVGDHIIYQAVRRPVDQD